MGITYFRADLRFVGAIGRLGASPSSVINPPLRLATTKIQGGDETFANRVGAHQDRVIDDNRMVTEQRLRLFRNAFSPDSDQFLITFQLW